MRTDLLVFPAPVLQHPTRFGQCPEWFAIQSLLTQLLPKLLFEELRAMVATDVFPSSMFFYQASAPCRLSSSDPHGRHSQPELASQPLHDTVSKLPAFKWPLPVRIVDDGKGMSRQHLECPGTLSNLKLRAEKLHAKLAIDSTPGSDTALALVMDRSKLASAPGNSCRSVHH